MAQQCLFRATALSFDVRIGMGSWFFWEGLESFALFGTKSRWLLKMCQQLFGRTVTLGWVHCKHIVTELRNYRFGMRERYGISVKQVIDLLV